MRPVPSTFKGPVITLGIPQWFSGEESACNAGDVGSIPGLERSPTGENGNRSSISCQDNYIDRGSPRATTHGSQRVSRD